MFQTNCRLLVLKAVHGGIDRFHKPQRLAPMHDVLVDEELVFLVERLGRLGDDDGIIGDKGLHFPVFVLSTVYQSINPAIDGHRIHVIVLA